MNTARLPTTLPSSGHQTGHQRIEALATEFLALREEGDKPQLADWLGRLDGAEERLEFTELIQDALSAGETLPQPLRPGVVIGNRWRIVRELGTGPHGQVFAGIDQHTGRPAALKLLAEFASSRVSPDDRFAREARALAAFGHPGIAAVHEIGQHGSRRVLVSDLVEGQSLHDVLAQVRDGLHDDVRGGWRAPRTSRPLCDVVGRQREPQVRPTRLDRRSWWHCVASLLTDAAETVEAAHDCGVVHGGLKPENLMVRPDGSVVVLDFGLHGALDEAGQQLTRSCFGDIACTTPEQLRDGGASADPRHDVYQLGLVLYELLTLRSAISGRSVSAMLEQISLGDIPRPRELDARIPLELEAICLVAADPDPDRRYPSMEAFRADLQRFLRGREVPQAARARSALRWSTSLPYVLRQHRVTLVLAAAALVGLAAFLLLSAG